MNPAYPVLILGANGQLGRDCMTELKADYRVAGVDLPDLDITQSHGISAIFDQYRPRAIINCAAWTLVDAAETKREAAQRVNAEGAARVANAAAAIGARLIHISTDYVFDGCRAVDQGGYTETDAVAPRCVYGRTKLAGEQAVLQSNADALVVRTAWLYGRHGANFPKTILRRVLAQPERELPVVHDQYGSPTWSARLAAQLAALLTADITGIVHASAEGSATWYEFAGCFLECMGIAHHLKPCVTADYPTVAPRPAMAVLENARLKAAGLNRMTDWRTDVAAFVVRHRNELMTETQAHQ